MIVNFGLIVLLLGGIISGILFWKAVDKKVEEGNRYVCGSFSAIIGVFTAALTLFFLGSDVTVDFSNLIRFKPTPSIFQKYSEIQGN